MKHQLPIATLTQLLVGFLLANPQSSHAGQSVPLELLISQTHMHNLKVSVPQDPIIAIIVCVPEDCA